MKTRMFLLSLALALLSVGAGTPPADRRIYRVYVRNQADVRRLAAGGWDLVEARGPDYLLVVGGAVDASRLKQLGYRVEADPLSPRLPQSADTFYSGYRTVAEHYQHLDDVAAAHPGLAVVVDYGDSWRKENAQPDGHDLKALCITRLRPGDCALTPATDKPRFLLMAAIHARELSTSEMAWRWIDFLVDHYGADPDVTWLLDSQEMWVVPVANPDGRHIVETSNQWQRKNANTTHCPPTVFQPYDFGVDLNRNASFAWGGIGSSSDECNDVYRGPSPASEPEEQAVESLMRQLFPDQRGPLITDTAPLTATGAMLTLHSYSNYVLVPWGYVDCAYGQLCPPGLRAPNDQQLRAFAFRMSYFNRYDTGQAPELLYAASGSTDDWAYGTLGIPGFTFEIGPGGGTCGAFWPDYACQDSVFWPENRGAFLYAAKAARQPYTIAAGPSTLTPTLSLTTAVRGESVTLSAVIDDTPFGPYGYGRPATQPISRAEYYVDLPPWAGGVPVPLAPQDGAFDSPTEAVTASLDTCDLPAGRRTIYVRGQDASGAWGPASAAWITVTDSAACLSVALDGPVIAQAGAGQAFIATASPPTLTLPITYAWSATGQPVVTHTAGLSATAWFTWPARGSQAVTVTIETDVGQAQSSRAVAVVAPGLYLPILAREE
jgi:hypothetical protein